MIFGWGLKREKAPKVFVQDYRLSAIANFTSNAFGYDYYGVGLEFGWKKMLMLRAAWRFEKGQFNAADRLDVYTQAWLPGLRLTFLCKKDLAGRILQLITLSAQLHRFRAPIALVSGLTSNS